MPNREDVIADYSRYLDACNRRDWAEVGAHVADRVLVNGTERSREEYVGDVRTTTDRFPDYRWRLVRTVLEGEWLAVQLHDTASADGVALQTDEFDLYRIVDGLIVELAGTADNARLTPPG